MRTASLAPVLVAALLLTACGGKPSPAPATPTPEPPAVATAIEPSPTPMRTATYPPTPTPLIDSFLSPLSPLAIAEESGLVLSTGREVAALEGYAVAEESARAWSPEAYFVGIVPSALGVRSLPVYPEKAGWVYRFARQGDARELYVQVVDGMLGQSGEAEAYRPEGERPQPVDPSLVRLNSPDLRQFYLDNLGGAEASNDYLDYALEFDPQQGRILWFLYDRARSANAVLVVDAATGEVLFPR